LLGQRQVIKPNQSDVVSSACEAGILRRFAPQNDRSVNGYQPGLPGLAQASQSHLIADWLKNWLQREVESLFQQ